MPDEDVYHIGNLILNGMGDGQAPQMLSLLPIPRRAVPVGHVRMRIRRVNIVRNLLAHQIQLNPDNLFRPRLPQLEQNINRSNQLQNSRERQLRGRNMRQFQGVNRRARLRSNVDRNSTAGSRRSSRVGIRRSARRRLTRPQNRSRSLSSNDTWLAGMAREISVAIPMEEGDPLGAVPNDKLVIVKVQSGTLADGKLKVGDQVLKLNNTTVQNCDHFFQLLRFAPPCANITLIRDEKKAAELESRIHIPPERAKFITRRDGYVYFLARINWKPGGPKLGLGIKHYQNRVLVSRCDSNSLASQQLQVGDHLIDIDGHPVTDKDVCRELLLKSLQTHRSVTTVVERPETMETKHWIHNALIASSAQAPSVAMNSDVRAIAARERKKLGNPAPVVSILKCCKFLKYSKFDYIKGIRLYYAAATPKKSCLRKNNVAMKRVNIEENKAAEYIIASDNEGKNLRHVRK
ncbi:unnamed protein product [Thelazia callipaeda]|uniref:PDZ domain-containing protein n=1 Tax=Thelazia callipaeda TaxID=103827 RepID=A0A0N5CYW8_THECL|nr:unnamed protein product [Thelazia callipaeda]